MSPYLCKPARGCTGDGTTQVGEDVESDRAPRIWEINPNLGLHLHRDKSGIWCSWHALIFKGGQGQEGNFVGWSSKSFIYSKYISIYIEIYLFYYNT